MSQPNEKTVSPLAAAALAPNASLLYIQDFLIWAKSSNFVISHVKFQDSEVDLVPPGSHPTGGG
jgi:hypothetical protein